MTGRKYSKQREAIKEYLTGNDSHPTADEVYYEVRKRYPSISLATVYRNLQQMSADGEILRLCCGSEPDHYDFRTERHGHFICGCCGRVYDVFLDFGKLKDASGELPGSVESCEILLRGTCRNCAGSDRGLRRGAAQFT